MLADFEQALDRRDYEMAASLRLTDLVHFGSGGGEEVTWSHSLAPMFTGLLERLADVFVDRSLDLRSGNAFSVRAQTALVVATGYPVLTTTTGRRTGRCLLTAVLHRTKEGWRPWQVP